MSDVTKNDEVYHTILDILNEDFKKINCPKKREYIESLITKVTQLKEINDLFI
jgi:hypothetical protein